MHKYQLLRQRAEEFRVILEEFSKKDSDVAFFLRLWLRWYNKVQQREIRLPCNDYKLFVYFANPDLSPLAERYGFDNANNKLFSAASNFDTAMRDYLSDPEYLARLQKWGEVPELVPDEQPPPEEEVPLPVAVEKSSLLQEIKRWLRRVIFPNGSQ